MHVVNTANRFVYQVEKLIFRILVVFLYCKTVWKSLTLGKNLIALKNDIAL